ncbi:hypothetical protein [Halocalculus aciditolerans]|uniref:Uncharacterized protein n=1 Tax=Halocalculus aciditolerans TaxID=1383812 RepID=A0A830FAG8_9EURY|nr:hypothetical protein [Halocalculus aciditolerans]GGL55161.1 hypothetical protein GCM10009039_11600 [Halocalculus aciditolerans]
MSSAGEAPSELTGAFIEIAKVTDLGATGESETVVGNTTADVSISKDQTNSETNKHSQRRSVRTKTYNTLDIEVPALLVPGASQLETMGVVDSDGEEIYGDVWDACRIHIYDKEPATASSPAQTFEFENVEWDWSEISLPEDYGEISFTGWVHGAWRRGKTATS